MSGCEAQIAGSVHGSVRTFVGREEHVDSDL